MKTQSICVTSGERVCINCRHYELYYQHIPGDYGWRPTSFGMCVLHDRQRGPLRQPCKDFEKEKGCNEN